MCSELNLLNVLICNGLNEVELESGVGAHGNTVVVVLLIIIGLVIQ